MEHEIATYFDEVESDDVHGFAIIGTVPSADEYHIAEKWYPNSDDEERWLQYHIPADTLRERLDAGKCEKVGSLSDEQFEKVCDKIDHDEVTPEKLIA